MKKVYIIIVLFSLVLSNLHGQGKYYRIGIIDTSFTEKVYSVADEMPTFEGAGPDDFLIYIHKNTKYPENAKDSAIQGRLFVKFVVEPDGTLSHIQVVKSVHPDLDKEAIRVIESSPKWTPGKLRGEIVRVTYTYPVTFILPKK